MPSLPKLRELLIQHFDAEGLRDLCTSLHTDYEDVSGETAAGKIRELILHFDRRGRLPELIEACARQRPDLPWEAGPAPASPQPASPARPGAFEQPAAKRPPQQGKEVEWGIEAPKIHTSLKLDCDFARFRKFVQEAFTPEELVEFVDRDDALKGLKFSLPVNASHNTITREMLEYAQRRNIIGLLLDALEKHNPALYAQRGPFIESGQLNIGITMTVKGKDSQLRTLQATPLNAETKQRLLKMAEQAVLQAGGKTDHREDDDGANDAGFG